MIGLAALSHQFPYGVDIEQAPLTLYIGLALVAGALWALLPFQISRPQIMAPALWSVLALGLVMRGAMFYSLPVLEDDSYRYLWDGAVTANGIDPYKYAPAAFSPDPVFASAAQTPSDPDYDRLQDLATANAEKHDRINYPFVSTIYPPLTQAAFAIAHWIDPFGLTGWRFVLLLGDLITVALLVRALKAFQRSPIWLCLYWWNPVVILQGFGAGHMDLLVLPFLLSALLLAKLERPVFASIALAGGAAVKIWPVILFPLLLRRFLKQPWRAMLYSAGFGLAVLILLLPQLVHAIRPEAGLNAYASDWRTHAFLFSILEDFVFALSADPGQISRLTVAAFMVSLTAWLALRFAKTIDRLPSLFAIIIAALIFVSPTGYPWYFIWLAPFLPFLPRAGLVALFVLAPLYWLRFQLGDDTLIYQWGIVPIAFGIPLALIALPHFNKRHPDAFRRYHPRIE